MEYSGDELAGVVDLFGALTHGELREALAELAFKEGADHDPDAFVDDVDRAVRSYHLVSVPAAEADVDVAAETVHVTGPVAFPALPPDVSDLPHILDVPERAVAAEAAGEAAAAKFRGDAADAVDAGDRERIAELLDVSYELEVWAPVELAAARERLDAALE